MVVEKRLEPQISIANDDPILFSLKGAANELAIRFLCPVYLVGSFLTNPKEALDIDVIFVMNEKRMKRLFGDIHFNDKQLKWRRKQKIYLEDHLRTYDFDVKVQLPKQFDYYSEPSMRLDSVDNNLLLPPLEELFTENTDEG